MYIYELTNRVVGGTQMDSLTYHGVDKRCLQFQPYNTYKKVSGAYFVTNLVMRIPSAKLVVMHRHQHAKYSVVQYIVLHFFRFLFSSEPPLLLS